MSLIDRVEREYDVAVIGGGSTTVGTLAFAVVRAGTKLTAETPWQDCSVVNGIVKVTYTAPLATKKTGDVAVLPGGNNVYARELDGDLVKAVFVDQVSVG